MSDTLDATNLLARLRKAVDPLDDPHPPPPFGPRKAAVLLLADPSEPGLPLLFMLRSERVRHHRGQISFPGGGVEEDDASIGDAALRENAEEMGIPREDVELIGKLPPLLTAVSNRWLTPIVGVLRRPVEVVADPFEVAEWFRVPIRVLMSAPHRIQEVEHEGTQRRIHYYDVDGRVIWGVTGAILQELLARLGRRD